MEEALLVIVGFIAIIVLIFVIGKQQNKQERFGNLVKPMSAPNSSYTISCQDNKSCKSAVLLNSTDVRTVAENTEIPLASLRADVNQAGKLYFQPSGLLDINDGQRATIGFYTNDQVMRQKLKDSTNYTAGFVTDENQTPLTETRFRQLYGSVPSQQLQVKSKEGFSNVEYRVQHNLIVNPPLSSTAEGKLSTSFPVSQVLKSYTDDPGLSLFASTPHANSTIKAYVCKDTNCQEYKGPSIYFNSNQDVRIQMADLTRSKISGENITGIKFDIVPSTNIKR